MANKSQNIKRVIRVAAAASSPTYKNLYDVVDGSAPKFDVKTVEFAVLGEDEADVAFVGGDKVTMPITIRPEPSGTRREGFDILLSASVNKTNVFVEVYAGPIVDGVKYTRRAFKVMRDQDASLSDVEKYTFNLTRTRDEHCTDVTEATYTAP